MDGGHVPRLPYRMVPPSMFKEFVQHLGQLLAKKLIRKSSRQYANPVVLVGKKTGGIRMCVDYRLLDNPLTHIMTQKRLPALEQRWVNALAGYNFTIKYRPGKHNANANGLSRRPQIPVTLDEVSSYMASVLGCTTLSLPLQTILEAEPLLESDKRAVPHPEVELPSTFPGYTVAVITQLQQADPGISAVLRFHQQHRWPSIEDWQALPKEAKE